MNLMHMKYAVEIANTHSMTKAAENLFTAQPNLSRAVRELESGLGIRIFKRTPKGLFPTVEGEEFLGYARKILQQIDDVEAMYQTGRRQAQRFSISVPRASYISCAFTEFLKTLDVRDSAEVFYKETNSLRAVNNIVSSDYRLGIVRYQAGYERAFRDLFEEKGLTAQLICEFKYTLLMAATHPLAEQSEVRLSELKPYIEIAHADPYVPSMPLSTVRKNESMDETDKYVYVFERGSQMDILSQVPGAFMWVSPVPQRLLDAFSLVQRPCPDNEKVYRDVLIHKSDYLLTELDHRFMDALMHYKRSVM